MDKAKHAKVTFCGLEKASKLVNDPFFHDLEEFDDTTFEVRVNSIFLIIMDDYLCLL